MKQEVLNQDVPIPQSVALPVLKGMQRDDGGKRYVLRLSGGSHWELTDQTMAEIGREVPMIPENIDFLFKNSFLRQVR